MKVLGIPYSGLDSATTRIRYHSFLKYLPEGFKAKEFKGKFNGDILYIQKKADPETIEIALKAQRKGMKVIYDLDDDFQDHPKKKREKMVALADAVTTDVQEWTVDLLRHATGPVHVVPDCVDYDGHDGEHFSLCHIEQVVTFGNTESVTDAASYIDGLPYRVSYITNREMTKYRNAEFIEWDRRSFILQLQCQDICFLSHSTKGKTKSNNRLLVCMKMGIPTIVSDAISYRRTLEAISHEWLIAHNQKEVEQIIERLKPDAVRLNVKYTFREAAKAYTPEISAARLASVMKEVMNGKD